MGKNTIRLAVIAATLMAAAANANAGERAIARLVSVSGNVLVSNEHTIASAGEALRLVPGMRVLVTLNSTAVVEYHDGCRVKLNSGERFEVRGDRPCAARTVPAAGAHVAVIGGRR